MQELGLSHLWTQGDIVTRSTAILLLIMSLASWIVILTKAWDIIRLKAMAQGAEKRFWHSDDFDHAMQTLGSPKDNPFYTLAQTGREAAQHHRASQPQLHDVMDISDWITRSLKSAIDESVGQMQSGLAVLASVGSTAPFVGLFGTVWGIMRSFTSIASQQNTSLAVVAPGIAEALFATAIGLFAAIPAVIAYNRFSHSINRIEARLNRFADAFHATLSRQLEVEVRR
jgi:biopolymer transport protein ExbB